MLTLLRTLLAVGGIALLVSGRWEMAALSAVGVALLLDAADGWLARRLGRATALGSFLDPLADKLVMTALYGYLGLKLGAGLGWALLAAVFARDCAVTAVRGWGFASHGEPMPAQLRGKLKTVFQSIAGFGLLVVVERAWVDPGIATNVFQGVLVIILGMSVFSAAPYLARVHWSEWKLRSIMQVRSESK